MSKEKDCNGIPRNEPNTRNTVLLGGEFPKFHLQLRPIDSSPMIHPQFPDGDDQENLHIPKIKEDPFEYSSEENMKDSENSQTALEKVEENYEGTKKLLVKFREMESKNKVNEQNFSRIDPSRVCIDPVS